MLDRLGEPHFEIRQARDLEKPLDRLIIPGGESTVMRRLLHDLDLFDTLRARITEGMPVFGTCAGLILLAKQVDGGVPCFATMDIAVKRNAYGRQLGSFFTNDSFEGLGTLPMTFIRAPYIESVSGGAKALELEERLAFVDRLLPHMTGWATCDLTGSAVKIFRERPEELLGHVGEKLASDDPWTVRVAEVWLLEHYRDARWTQAALDLLGGGTSRALPLAASGDYYLSMSLAWCLSMLATADLEAVCSRIESWRAEGRLDDVTLRRTVRKIRESLQFTKETKAAVSARFAAR